MKTHWDSQTQPNLTKFWSRIRILLIATCALSFWPAVASTQQETLQSTPEHAHVKDYGTGWDCDRGYRLSDERECVYVEVPENAFLSFSGQKWQCHRGYRKGPDACTLIEVPKNARLADFVWEKWACNRGYRNVHGSCVKIEIPVNGYLR